MDMDIITVRPMPHAPTSIEIDEWIYFWLEPFCDLFNPKKKGPSVTTVNWFCNNCTCLFKWLWPPSNSNEWWILGHGHLQKYFNEPFRSSQWNQLKWYFLAILIKGQFSSLRNIEQHYHKSSRITSWIMSRPCRKNLIFKVLLFSCKVSHTAKSRIMIIIMGKNGIDVHRATCVSVIPKLRRICLLLSQYFNVHHHRHVCVCIYVSLSWFLSSVCVGFVASLLFVLAHFW